MPFRQGAFCNPGIVAARDCQGVVSICPCCFVVCETGTPKLQAEEVKRDGWKEIICKKTALPLRTRGWPLPWKTLLPVACRHDCRMLRIGLNKVSNVNHRRAKFCIRCAPTARLPTHQCSRYLSVGLGSELQGPEPATRFLYNGAHVPPSGTRTTYVHGPPSLA